MDFDSSNPHDESGLGIEKAESEKKMRAAYKIRQCMCCRAASLYLEIGKSTRRWFSSFGKSRSQSVHKQTIRCLV